MLLTPALYLCDGLVEDRLVAILPSVAVLRSTSVAEERVQESTAQSDRKLQQSLA